MKELVRHIEILLLDHDCVVVPQVGGFVTRNVPAQYVEDEHLFLPPIRTVGFNERLKADDGLLVGSYVSAFRCTETEARKMLGEQIRDLQQELWENGTYDLGSIGVLTQDDQNDIQFSPCQAGTVCPAYYGLDALFFEPLAAEHTAKAEPATTVVSMSPATDEVPSRRDDADEDNHKDEIVIRIKKAWLHNVAAIAAVVMLFFLVAPDVQSPHTGSNTQAEFPRMMWMPAMQEKAPEVAMPESEEVETEAAQTEEVPTPHTAATEVAPQPSQTGSKEIQTPTADAHNYCVVVASAITQTNAERLVERLHKDGHTEAQIYKKGSMVRVVFPGYATEAEAYAKAKSLGNQSEDFAYAWVYKIK